MQSEFVKERIHLSQYVQANFANDANRHDRGVRQAGFLVLNATSMPSILVELGYISNAEEAKYLASASAQKRLSDCISKAFDKYYADLRRLSGDTHFTATSSQEGAMEESVNDEEVSATTASSSSSKAEEVDVQDEKASTAVVTVKEKIPVFKVQFLSSSKKLNKGDIAFKGLSPVSYYYDKGLYKYTYGETADYNEILRTKRKVNEKFKDAFIVAFIDGERVDTQHAIALFKKQNP